MKELIGKRVYGSNWTEEEKKKFAWVLKQIKTQHIIIVDQFCNDTLQHTNREIILDMPNSIRAFEEDKSFNEGLL